MVLATEMMKHFEHLNKFVNSINKMTQKVDETSSLVGIAIKVGIIEPVKQFFLA